MLVGFVDGEEEQEDPEGLAGVTRPTMRPCWSIPLPSCSGCGGVSLVVAEEPCRGVDPGVSLKVNGYSVGDICMHCDVQMSCLSSYFSERHCLNTYSHFADTVDCVVGNRNMHHAVQSLLSIRV